MSGLGVRKPPEPLLFQGMNTTPRPMELGRESSHAAWRPCQPHSISLPPGKRVSWAKPNWKLLMELGPRTATTPYLQGGAGRRRAEGCQGCLGVPGMASCTGSWTAVLCALLREDGQLHLTTGCQPYSWLPPLGTF